MKACFIIPYNLLFQYWISIRMQGRLDEWLSERNQDEESRDGELLTSLLQKKYHHQTQLEL